MKEILIFLAIVICHERLFANGLGNSLNLAKGRSTTSSTAASISGQAVDENRNTNFFASSCWETAVNDWNPYWMVDLGREFNITSVSVTNRGDCCGDRLRDFVIEACQENPQQVPAALCFLCHYCRGEVALGATESLACTKPLVFGRYVRIRGFNRQHENDRFTLCEVEVYDDNDPCFKIAYSRKSSSRSNGAVAVLSDTSRADCSSVCVRHSTCIAFNYNIDISTCEMVTVAGSLLSSPEWDYYQINP